ncbi:transposable element Tc3 transposase [Trichonephila clavipes]|nr:transposable element Tc3 transposase [Trichonephila clavipes]
MPSPRFEPRPDGTTVSVTNHYAGGAASGRKCSPRHLTKVQSYEVLEPIVLLFLYSAELTCHTARATIDLLKDTFGDRLISRFGPVNWPPRSCDLTLLDYSLWGYVKSLVYADKPQTLDHLEDNISRVIADIRPQMLEKVIENWTSRLDYIRASRGSPMPEIIFRICQVIYSQFGLAIHQNDHQARRRFVEWAQNEIAVVSDFHKRILFSDEAHFWLNGYVNKQNCRIWSEANPQVYVETPLHPEKLTVWCAL